MAARPAVPRAAPPDFYLPDLCAPRMVLVVVLIAELVAVLVAVARAGLADFWLDLARISLFVLWIALGCAAALCYLRPRLARLGVRHGSSAVLALVALVTALVSEVAWWSAAQSSPLAGQPALLPGRSHAGFTAGNVAIALIAAAVGLRYAYVAHEWRRNVEREARSRVDALQARIRPHFLYNSMNTIAALTRSDPRRAEEAVEDLADLFRASLSETRSEVTLAEEFEIARTYQRIEQLRLGPRLQVEWRLEGVPTSALVPSLLVQPLLENAIYHGIERLPGGGTVHVRGRLDGDRIELAVANPRAPADAPAHQGNRIALANLRERLELAWPGEARVELEEGAEEFVVRLCFPRRERAVA